METTKGMNLKLCQNMAREICKKLESINSSTKTLNQQKTLKNSKSASSPHSKQQQQKQSGPTVLNKPIRWI